MPESDLLVIVFAPATVGLIVMACRRLPLSMYLAASVAVLALALVSLGQQPLGAELSLLGQLAFATVFLGAPTLAAFAIGRLTAVHLGGAYVFATACSAYLFGLGIAAVLVASSRILTP